MSAETTSPQAGTKRAYQAEESIPVSEKTAASPSQNTASATSAFRNVSACNRCRVRKNRCDQQLPACSACTKAHVRCVGYDPITKREIPRSYVYFLETRLAYFEKLLVANDVSFDPGETFDADSRRLGGNEVESPVAQTKPGPAVGDHPNYNDANQAQQKQEDERLDHLVSNIGMVSVHGTSDHRYLGSTSGISFARVVLSAVKKATPNGHGERGASKVPNSAAAAATSGRSMRETYFGLQTKPSINEAPFPERELGEKLVMLYFEHANPQIPILHRDEFMEMFERTYSVPPEERTPRELYLLNIVCAIGAGIIWGSSDSEPEAGGYSSKRPRLSGQQAQPEEYHASAIVHLGSFLSSSGNEGASGDGGDLEELQAVLLLAGFALLRPIAPGLWYIVGVAMRLAIDLGLHYEDGSGLHQGDFQLDTTSNIKSKKAQQHGRRQWMRDLRRRLWWCTYTFDRLVSTCVGRPFGITDQVITTEFPSLLDDKYITRDGIVNGVPAEEPSYKRVAHHYFRLRLLQSEIVQVLQYQQAQMARMKGWNRHNDFMHTKLPSPFLVKHKSFKSWRKDIDQRLFEWKEAAPYKQETGVSFSTQFLELNYWQAVTMLYRQSLSVPAIFAGELSPTEDVASPSSVFTEDKEDEDLVFLKCAEAGQKTLKIYRQLHRLRLVNYTYLATHHLFMAGIAFLYAVWHSPAVRSRISLDEFDFTVLAATSVLGDLMVKCPPAEACRDAFERMSKATVQMCMSSPSFGFGSREEQYQSNPEPSAPRQIAPMPQGGAKNNMPQPAKRPPPRFDMSLQDLFPDGLNPTSRSRAPSGRPRSHTQRSARQARAGATQKISNQLDVKNTGQSSAGTTMRDAEAMYAAPSMHNTSYQTFDHSQQQTFEESYPLDVSSNTYNPDFISNLPGMDFLHRLSTSGGEASSHTTLNQSARNQAANNIDPNLEENWLDVGQTGSVEGDAESDWGLGSGFGVGVGMGLDFGPQHDWSDGQGGFNLFDGFFFGGDDGTINQ
ncbi:hypothetical protein PMZ80_007702 [Knufia obscura]|uniref:Zn(2)-C6 fungal-type domain-containing protein n=1 Tax=Knufia obscura TaxID=1635080 RepID=A0ABR0RJ21_9EURO|nr:hypothetical protein PMZ80_007702 [Knufia obscura]